MLRVSGVALIFFVAGLHLKTCHALPSGASAQLPHGLHEAPAQSKAAERRTALTRRETKTTVHSHAERQAVTTDSSGHFGRALLSTRDDAGDVSQLEALLSGPDPAKAIDKAKDGSDKYGAGKDGTPLEKAAIDVIVKQKAEVKAQAQALAYVLIGMVLLLTSIFYLVHSNDEHVVGMTWRTLSDAMGLFAAILLFFTDKDFTTLLFQGEDGLSKDDKSKDGAGPDAGMLMFSFFRVVLNYIIVMVILWKFKHKRGIVNAVGNLGAHVIAFSSADFFGQLQECEPFSDSVGASFLAVPIALLFGLSVRHFGDKIRKTMAESAHGTIDHDDLHEWEHQCAHTEDEFTAFTVGLLISQFCRFQITGHLPPMYGYKKKKVFEFGQIMSLFSYAMFFGLCVVIAGALVAGQTNPRVKSMLATTQAIMSMAMAWSLHFSSKWLFYFVAGQSGSIAGGVKIVGKVAMALIFSPLGFLAIILCDMIADKVPQLSGLRAMCDGFVLLIGLAWEKTFMQAIDSMETDSGDMSITETTVHRGMFSLLLVAFVAPAWGMYILPKAVAALHAGHGHGHEDHGHGEHGHDDHANGDHGDGHEKKLEAPEGHAAEPAAAASTEGGQVDDK